MNRMRELENNVENTLADLLNIDRANPAQLAKLTAFQLALAMWIDARAQEAVSPEC